MDRRQRIEGKTVRVMANLSPDLAAFLAREAETQMRSRSAMVAIIIEGYRMTREGR